ncbi:uncharacterized protein LOC62_06G008463 [Vanrija pseudolonga]|uniref:Uncharacterized protein n=1 Tax=Vanrija pseudolonga TaxID=143232 RepID=A0AAF1BKR2_9TREE|nr:hypothetical protein LOC62_06G008463 [Vanrija pseudolonga]
MPPKRDPMPPKRHRSSSLTAAPSSELSSPPASPKKQRTLEPEGTRSLGIPSPEHTPVSSSSSSQQVGTPTPAPAAFPSSTASKRARRQSSALPEAGPSKPKPKPKPKATPKGRARTTGTADASTPSRPAPKKRKASSAVSSSPARYLASSPEPVSPTPRSARRPSPPSSLTDLPSSPLKAPSSRTGSPAPRKTRTADDDSGSEDGVLSLGKWMDRSEREGKVKGPRPRSPPVGVRDPTPPLFKPTQLPSGVGIGDPCLVKDRTCYFVAVLLAFHPATTREEQQRRGGDKYEVEDQTGERRLVARHHVLFESDGEPFAKAKIGQLKEVAVKRTTLDVVQRTTSVFKDLDREHQLEQIKPHLHAIVKEEFEPAQWRADLFFDGEFGLLDKNTSAGDIPEDEAQNVIIPWLFKWNNGAMASDETVRHPPEGSERHDALRDGQRLSYVSRVLFPEAVIELCIRSYDIPGSPAEAYATAKDKLEELAGQAFTWRSRRTNINHQRREIRRKFDIKSDDEDDEERRRHEYNLTPINAERRERKAPTRFRGGE